MTPVGKLTLTGVVMAMYPFWVLALMRYDPALTVAEKEVVAPIPDPEDVHELAGISMKEVLSIAETSLMLEMVAATALVAVKMIV